MAEVWFPPALQDVVGGQQKVIVSGRTIRQIITNLEKEYPGVWERLVDEEADNLMPGLAAVIDGEAGILGLMERVGEDSEVHFLPAIGGGDF